MEIFPPILSYSSMLLCCLTQQSSLKHSHKPFIMSPSFPLLFSFVWLMLVYLHLLKQAHTLLVHTKWSLPPFSICWAITCRIISQMKGRNAACYLLIAQDLWNGCKIVQNRKSTVWGALGVFEAQTQSWQIWPGMIHTFVDWSKLILSSNIHLGNWVQIIVL